MPVTDALTNLTGPGGTFEIVVEDVLGNPLQVYRRRLGSMRDLVEGADARGDVDWLVQGDRRLTYGEHNALVRRTAVALLELGVGPGDRVAVLSANNVEWVVMFWACAVIGAACVPLNAWWKAEELEFALRDGGARVLVCDRKRWEVVRDVVGSLDALEHVFVTDLDAPDGPARPGAELLAAEDPGALPDVTVHEDDLLAILYTSGTTGRPKGCDDHAPPGAREPQNLACLGGIAAAQGAVTPRADLQTAYLLVVPLFHVTGALATMVPGYASGGKLVLMPPGKFDPDEAMAVIERERVTNIGGVPTVMWRIVEAESFGRYDLSSVSRIGYGGAPAAPSSSSGSGRVPAGPRHALHRVRAHRDRVGRDVERRRGLPLASELGGSCRADGRDPGRRRRTARRCRSARTARSCCAARRS